VAISATLFGLCFFGYVTVFGGMVVRWTRELSSVYMGKITLVHAVGQVVGVYAGGVLRDATGSFRVPFLLSLLVAALSLVFFSMGISREGRSEVTA
jgi:predicted MFS family arabinose efflux permease